MAKYADLSDWWDAWAQYIKDTIPNEGEQYLYIWTLDHYFLSWLSGHKKEDVTPALLERWKGEMTGNIRPTTINTTLSTIRKFFNWAQEHKYLSDNPTEGVKNVKREGANKAHLRDRLEDDEIRRMLEVPNRSTEIGKRDHAYLCIKAYTGLRDIELHRADYDDLSTVDGVPVLRVQGKGRSEGNRVAVIRHPEAQEALNEWLAVRGTRGGPLFTSFSDRSLGERLSLRAIRGMVRHSLRVAGVDDRRKTSHSIRHSAITKVAQKNLLKAQEMAGHRDPNVTLIYAHEVDRINNPGEQFIEYED